MVVSYSSFSNSGPTRTGWPRASDFPDLSGKEIEELARIAHLKQCSKGEILLGEQEKAAIVGGVVSGVLRLQKTLADGRFHIVGFRFAGHTFGRLFCLISSVSVEAAEDCVIWTAERKAFEALAAQHKGLERQFLKDALAELDEARERIVLLGSTGVNERLARFVLRYVDQKGIIHIPVGRKDLAGLLGTTAESISRFGHELAERRIARFRGADTIEVLDWAGLLKFAGLDESEVRPAAEQTDARPGTVRPASKGRSTSRKPTRARHAASSNGRAPRKPARPPHDTPLAS